MVFRRFRAIGHLPFKIIVFPWFLRDFSFLPLSLFTMNTLRENQWLQRIDVRKICEGAKKKIRKLQKKG